MKCIYVHIACGNRWSIMHLVDISTNGEEMDRTGRKMTKIVRELTKFTAKMMKDSGIGSSEFDVVHAIRKHPCISQHEITEELGIDKGALARMIRQLEKKGYVVRESDPEDGRRFCLYATAKAKELKHSKAHIESLYYDFLLEALDEKEQEQFALLLDKLYWRSKVESRTGFMEMKRRIEEEGGCREEETHQ